MLGQIELHTTLVCSKPGFLHSQRNHPVHDQMETSRAAKQSPCWKYFPPSTASPPCFVGLCCEQDQSTVPAFFFFISYPYQFPVSVQPTTKYRERTCSRVGGDGNIHIRASAKLIAPLVLLMIWRLGWFTRGDVTLKFIHVIPEVILNWLAKQI